MALTVVSAGAPPVPRLADIMGGHGRGLSPAALSGVLGPGTGGTVGALPLPQPFIISAALGAVGSSWWCRGKGLGLEEAGPGRDGAGQGPGL